MTAQPAVLDREKAQAFGGRVMEIINGSSLALGLSVGHRTGLFDVMATLPPSTSDEIARAAGLNERYVREWLASMTVGRVVDYDPSQRRFSLPAEHAASLTRAAGPANIASHAQFAALIGSVEDEVVASFRNGGGVGYDRFHGFARMMRSETEAVFDAALVQAVLPLVDGLIEKLRIGGVLADVGCGGGRAVNIIARAFPNSTITGYDFSDEGIGLGRAEAAEWGLSNARFELRDVAKLDIESEYDAITAFDAIHDQAHPRRVLAGIYRALKPGGTFLMADVAGSSNLEENLNHPLGPMCYTTSYFHCMTVSLAQGGEGLGTMWGTQKALELLAEAGFTSTEVRKVEGDYFNNYFISRK